MSRIIKFRGFFQADLDLGRPILFEQKQIDGEWFWVCKEDNLIQYPFADVLFDGDFIPQQFTGLTDKDGSEIFEGDIVLYSSIGWTMYSARNCKIHWSNKDVAFVIKSLDGAFTWSLSNELAKNSLKVVGNIYQNPDLLKS